MLDFGANPIERQLILSAQFLHNELPVRLAHRVAELENLPFGLSAKSPVIKARRMPPLSFLAAWSAAQLIDQLTSACTTS